MSDENVLTKEIAEQFLPDEDSVDLSEFTAMEDEAAEVLSKRTSDYWLNLDGLLSLSDESAMLLSKMEEGGVFISNVRRITASRGHLALIQSLVDMACSPKTDP